MHKLEAETDNIIHVILCYFTYITEAIKQRYYIFGIADRKKLQHLKYMLVTGIYTWKKKFVDFGKVNIVIFFLQYQILL